MVDFGVARLLDDDAVHQTRAGLVIGTLAYMSPEQARGDVEIMDTRSDVYALGVIGYEVLTGRHLLGDEPGTFTQVVRRIVEETPPDPAAVNPRLRGDPALILAKALTKEPEQRYASASALAEDLRRHLRNEPILARPLTGAYQMRWFLRRHRKVVMAAALGLGLLVAGLVGAVTLARSERRQRLRADGSTAAMRRALVHQRLQAAASSLRMHDTRAAGEALERIDPEDRGWEWAYLAADADDSIDHLPLDLGPLRAPASEDGPPRPWCNSATAGSRSCRMAGAHHRFSRGGNRAYRLCSRDSATARSWQVAGGTRSTSTTPRS